MVFFTLRHVRKVLIETVEKEFPRGAVVARAIKRLLWEEVAVGSFPDICLSDLYSPS